MNLIGNPPRSSGLDGSPGGVCIRSPWDTTERHWEPGWSMSHHTLKVCVFVLPCFPLSLSYGAFQSLGADDAAADESLGRCMSSLDTDGDGKISFEEFCALAPFCGLLSLLEMPPPPYVPHGSLCDVCALVLHTVPSAWASHLAILFADQCSILHFSVPFYLFVPFLSWNLYQMYKTGFAGSGVATPLFAQSEETLQVIHPLPFEPSHTPMCPSVDPTCPNPPDDHR